jgi:hypothetical protein
MTKKINIINASIFLVIFLIGFRFSYKNSGKFRKSIQIALICATTSLLPVSVGAKSNFPGADGFTPPGRLRPGVGNGYGSGGSSSSAGQPSRHPFRVNPFPRAHKALDLGLGAGVNPDGAGGGSGHFTSKFFELMHLLNHTPNQ